MRGVFAIMLIAGCSRGSSFRDSIAALCDGDAGPQLANLDAAARQAAVQAWLDDHIRDRDGKDFVATIADMRPWMRRRQILRAAEDQHVPGCKPIAALTSVRAPLGVNVPELSSAGVEPIDDGSPFLAVMTASVEIDTKPFDLDGAGLALAGRALRAQVSAAHAPIRFATVAAARTTRCEQLAPVLDFVKTNGISSVRFVVTVGGADRAVAIDLPRAATGDVPDATIAVGATHGDALRAALAQTPAGTLRLICEPDATLDALVTVIAAARASGHDARFAIPPRPPEPR